ncbi:hypothetical protein NLJ89_g1597 [Agrocybe chaxingu]|uniref:Uncharacterized protein n=1 Tax=Agrocybe chaxingu TaxID=84603 RepID=A0A9W8MZR5_9AGAR|nr:hypothetical protein NLJ89_g1597 [Agrocybe chaxingu]
MFSLQGNRSSIFAEAARLLFSEDLTIILNALHGEDYGIETLNFHLVSHEIWPDGIASITKPILSLIASPFLRSLAITHFNNIPVDFIDNTQITRLSLKGVNFKQATVLARGRRPPIKTFSSNSRIPDAFNDTPSNSLFRELKSFLTVCETALHFANARQILAAASQTVAHVDLSAFGPVTHSELFDLSLLPNLATLHLTDGTSTSSVFPHNGRGSISFLTAILDVQGLLANLTNLTLLVHLSGDVFHDTDFSNIVASEPNSEWERLDRILTGPHYPSLAHLKFSFFFEVRFQATEQVPEPGQDFDEDTFNDLGAARVKELFPRLSKHSQIELTIDVDCWNNVSRRQNA